MSWALLVLKANRAPRVRQEHLERKARKDLKVIEVLKGRKEIQVNQVHHLKSPRHQQDLLMAI